MIWEPLVKVRSVTIGTVYKKMWTDVTHAMPHIVFALFCRTMVER